MTVYNNCNCCNPAVPGCSCLSCDQTKTGGGAYQWQYNTSAFTGNCAALFNGTFILGQTSICSWLYSDATRSISLVMSTIGGSIQAVMILQSPGTTCDLIYSVVQGSLFDCTQPLVLAFDAPDSTNCCTMGAPASLTLYPYPCGICVVPGCAALPVTWKVTVSGLNGDINCVCANTIFECGMDAGPSCSWSGGGENIPPCPIVFGKLSWDYNSNVPLGTWTFKITLPIVFGFVTFTLPNSPSFNCFGPNTLAFLSSTYCINTPAATAVIVAGP